MIDKCKKVNSITESTTVYNVSTSVSDIEFIKLDITLFPNPASELIAIEIISLLNEFSQMNMFRFAEISNTVEI